jgi:predicted ATPase
LYGRELERAALGSAFARATAGIPTLVLLAGRQGADHNDLVRDLVRSEAANSPCAVGGWKIAGERPLAGISEALGSLASNLLLLDDQRLAALRATLTRSAKSRRSCSHSRT